MVDLGSPWEMVTRTIWLGHWIPTWEAGSRWPPNLSCWAMWPTFRFATRSLPPTGMTTYSWRPGWSFRLCSILRIPRQEPPQWVARWRGRMILPAAAFMESTLTSSLEKSTKGTHSGVAGGPLIIIPSLTYRNMDLTGITSCVKCPVDHLWIIDHPFFHVMIAILKKCCILFFFQRGYSTLSLSKNVSRPTPSSFFKKIHHEWKTNLQFFFKFLSIPSRLDPSINSSFCKLPIHPHRRLAFWIGWIFFCNDQKIHHTRQLIHHPPHPATFQ